MKSKTNLSNKLALHRYPENTLLKAYIMIGIPSFSNLKIPVYFNSSKADPTKPFLMENVDVFSNADVHEVNKWLNQKKSEFSFGKMQFERKKLPVTKCSFFNTVPGN